jgi:hypothetical protein
MPHIGNTIDLLQAVWIQKNAHLLIKYYKDREREAQDQLKDDGDKPPIPNHVPPFPAIVLNELDRPSSIAIAILSHPDFSIVEFSKMVLEFLNMKPGKDTYPERLRNVTVQEIELF